MADARACQNLQTMQVISAAIKINTEPFFIKDSAGLLNNRFVKETEKN